MSSSTSRVSLGARASLLAVGSLVSGLTLWLNGGIGLGAAGANARDAIERLVLGYGLPHWPAFTWIALAIPCLGFVGVVVAACLRRGLGAALVLLTLIAELGLLLRLGWMLMWFLPLATALWIGVLLATLLCGREKEHSTVAP